ncbi:hypothetical protein ACI3ER_12335 [Bacillus sp. Wb]
MSHLKNLRGEPTFIEGIGNVYPIKIRDWEKFESMKEMIVIRKEHFYIKDEAIENFDIIMANVENNYQVKDKFESLLSLLLKCDLLEKTRDDKGYSSYLIGNDETGEITRDNYDKFRSVVMEQNLLIEPKVYKNAVFAQWAEKSAKANSNGAISITMESKISTVAAMEGRDFEDYDNYTYYQFEDRFNRICKIEESRSQSIMFANPYADFSKMKLVHFAESINLRKDPYKDLFKDSSELGKLDQAVK